MVFIALASVVLTFLIGHWVNTMHFGFVPATISGVAGGFLIAMVTTNRPIASATLSGSCLALVGIATILHTGFDPLGRSFFLWAWPIYYLPGYLAGALIVVSYSR